VVHGRSPTGWGCSTRPIRHPGQRSRRRARLREHHLRRGRPRVQPGPVADHPTSIGTHEPSFALARTGEPACSSVNVPSGFAHSVTYSVRDDPTSTREPCNRAPATADTRPGRSLTTGAADAGPVPARGHRPRHHQPADHQRGAHHHRNRTTTEKTTTRDRRHDRLPPLGYSLIGRRVRALVGTPVARMQQPVDLPDKSPPDTTPDHAYPTSAPTESTAATPANSQAGADAAEWRDQTPPRPTRARANRPVPGSARPPNHAQNAPCGLIPASVVSAQDHALVSPERPPSRTTPSSRSGESATVFLWGHAHLTSRSRCARGVRRRRSGRFPVANPTPTSRSVGRGRR
jgi:hypothetical protein